MKTIRIAFADFWKGFETNWNFITPTLKKYFNVVVDRNNPDVLFCSTLHSMSLADTYHCPKILFIFESHPVTGYKDVEYTFSYAPHSEKNFYFPEWQIHTFVHTEIIPRLFNRPKLDFSKAKFCSFVYSNPEGKERNELFHALNKYKEISSYGQLFRNDWSLEKIFNGVGGYSKEDYFLEHPHKFAICYERDSLPGYCSEKLMNGFLSGSIPIYWGDPLVNDNFNENSFIHANNYTIDSLVEEIIDIEKSKFNFNSLASQPVFTEKQKNIFLNNMTNFEVTLIEQVKKLL